MNTICNALPVQWPLKTCPAAYSICTLAYYTLQDFREKMHIKLHYYIPSTVHI